VTVRNGLPGVLTRLGGLCGSLALVEPAVDLLRADGVAERTEHHGAQVHVDVTARHSPLEVADDDLGDLSRSRARILVLGRAQVVHLG
jgi:hypothetical protein